MESFTPNSQSTDVIWVGIDEVGRGCLAGPISACAFAFYPASSPVKGLKDSKKLSPLARQRLVPQLERAGWFGHASCSAQEIDEKGISLANKIVMQRALIDLIETHCLPAASLHVIIDGNQRPPFDEMGLAHYEAIIKADDLHPVVSAASVLAKVRRDQWMADQALKHPGYGFEKHYGYGSATHMNALREQGPCHLHRMTFSMPRKNVSASED